MDAVCLHAHSKPQWIETMMMMVLMPMLLLLKRFLLMLTIYKNTTKAYDSGASVGASPLYDCGGKVFPFIENAEEMLTKHTMLTHPKTFWTEHFACYTHNLIPFSASISMCAFYVLDGVYNRHIRSICSCGFCLTLVGKWIYEVMCLRRRRRRRHTLWKSQCEQLTP